MFTNTKTKLTHIFCFVKNRLPGPNLFHENETDTQHANSAGYWNFATMQTKMNIRTLSNITDHVTKEEGRTASGHTPKGIVAYYSDLHLQ